jgi:hypothetical protein
VCRAPVDTSLRRTYYFVGSTVDRTTHRRGPAATAKAQERPAADPARALLVAMISVLLALALGTGLFLLLPAAV